VFSSSELDHAYGTVGCHGRDGSSHIFVSFLTLYSTDKKKNVKKLAIQYVV
jgi:hypothetical protein